MEKVSRMNEESIRGLLRVLADENERLDAVLDSMLDGIVVCDDVITSYSIHYTKLYEVLHCAVRQVDAVRDAEANGLDRVGSTP